MLIKAQFYYSKRSYEAGEGGPIPAKESRSKGAGEHVMASEQQSGRLQLWAWQNY